MFDLFHDRKSWLALALVLALPSVMLQADDDDDDDDDEKPAQQVDPEAWKENRKAIEAAIAKEIKAQVDKLVTHEKIVRGLSGSSKSMEEALKTPFQRERKVFYDAQVKTWSKKGLPDYPKCDLQIKTVPDWAVPVAKPVKDKAQHKKDLTKSLAKSFLAAYPPPDKAALEVKAHELYPLYKVERDTLKQPVVTFTLRGGKGSNTLVKGRLQAVTAERIKVSGSGGVRYLRRDDLDDKAQSMFYAEVNKRFVDDYVSEEIRKYNAARELFVDDWLAILLPERLMMDNYVPKQYESYLSEFKKKHNPNLAIPQRKSHNLDVWETRAELETRIYERTRTQVRQQLTPKITKDFFEHARDKELYDENFEFVKEANGGQGEWMPNTVAASWRQAQTAAETVGPNGPGPDGPGPDGPGPDGPGPDGPGPR